MRESDGKTAFFDGRNFLTGFEFDYINFYGQYPFLSFSSADYANGPKGVINVLSGNYYPNSVVIEYGNIGYVVVNNKTGEYNLFTFKGEPINPEKLKLSSKKHEVFLDETKKLWGIRNTITNEIVVEPKYKLRESNSYKVFWVNNVVELHDSISPELNYISVIVNEDGEELFRGAKDKTYFFNKDFISSRDPNDFFNDSLMKYYDYSGLELESLQGASWASVTDGIYANDATYKLYFSVSNSIKNNVKHPTLSGEFIIYTNPLSEKQYICDIYNIRQFGPFDRVALEGFNEGVAVVSRDGLKFLIDKNGKEYHYPNNIEIGDQVSEGVIKVHDDLNGVYGYV